MATTTPNFGWAVPTSTDLVKDGAVAIETLGDSIDASLVDLKGGTTGQVLAKATGTDMDFTWSTPSAGSSNVAGKNGVLNSGFNVWQRGTSVSVAANNQTYTSDRWMLGSGVNQACTVSRQTTSDTTNLPFIQYCARVQRNSGQTGTGGIGFTQSFETINSIPYVGKTVTFSFYARAGANYSATSGNLLFILRSGTGTDQNVTVSGFTGAASVASGTVQLTTTWQRFSGSGTVASSATQLAAIYEMTPTGTAGVNDYFEVTGVQLEIAASASAYSPNAGTFQGELAACQRYYYKQSSGDNTNISMGSQYSATELQTIIAFPVSMRTNPSAVIGSGTDIYRFYRNGTFDSFNNLTRNATFSGSGSVNSINLYNSSEISGTAGWAGVINGAAAGCSIAFDAEL